MNKKVFILDLELNLDNKFYRFPKCLLKFDKYQQSLKIVQPKI